MTAASPVQTPNPAESARADESLPELTKAPIPVQTNSLRWEERVAKGRALRDVAARNRAEGMETALPSAPIRSTC